MLTDTALRNLKPKSKPYKASDRDGMYVTVSTTGTVTFRYDYLKSLLVRAGCPRGAVKDIGSLKLLQALLNVIERLNAHEEASDAFASGSEPEGWNDRNEAVAPLFLNNDLRIADAHETVEQCLTTLQLLGFDTANVNAGYGRALDFVMDGVITALGTVATAIEKLLRPK